MTKKYVIRSTDYYGELYDVVDVPVKENPVPKEAKLFLKSGDKIKVTWPDKKITIETINVNNGYGSAQVDMNNYPDHFPTRSFSVVREYHKCEILIPLRKGTIVYEYKKRK